MTASVLLFAPPCERIPLPSMGRVARIQNLVANSYNIAPESMRSQSRARLDAWPRQVGMYLCRQVYGMALPKIAREFGNRDHTTVVYAVRQVQNRMAADPIYRADVEALRKALA